MSDMKKEQNIVDSEPKGKHRKYGLKIQTVTSEEPVKGVANTVTHFFICPLIQNMCVECLPYA